MGKTVKRKASAKGVKKYFCANDIDAELKKVAKFADEELDMESTQELLNFCLTQNENEEAIPYVMYLALVRTAYLAGYLQGAHTILIANNAAYNKMFKTKEAPV